MPQELYIAVHTGNGRIDESLFLGIVFSLKILLKEIPYQRNRFLTVFVGFDYAVGDLFGGKLKLWLN